MSAVGRSAIRDLLELTVQPGVLSLAGGLPDPRMMPTRHELIERLDHIDCASALQYGPTEGHPELRRTIAEQVLTGVDTADVLVTTGAQQGLRLLCEALIEPGDVVVVERHTYVGMLQPLRAHRAEVVTVGSDHHGLRTLDLAAKLRTGLRPAAVYLAPTFQNPTGIVMSDERRRQLANLANRYGFVVIDDDPYRDLSFDGQAPSRLRDHVDPDLAVSVGSFSKSLAPGLRVGWVHAPSWLHRGLVTLKQATDLHTGMLAQTLVESLLSDSTWLDGHLAELRRVYAHRSRVLSDALVSTFGDRVEVGRIYGGMFAWATVDRLPGGADALSERCLARGVGIVPGSVFDPEARPSCSARLCFASCDDDDLREAVRRIALAVGDLDRAS